MQSQTLLAEHKRHKEALARIAQNARPDEGINLRRVKGYRPSQVVISYKAPVPAPCTDVPARRTRPKRIVPEEEKKALKEGRARSRKKLSSEELENQMTLCSYVVNAVCSCEMEVRWLQDGCRSAGCSFSRRIIAYICLKHLKVQVQCQAVGRVTGAGREAVSIASLRCSQEIKKCSKHQARVASALERLRAQGIQLKDQPL